MSPQLFESRSYSSFIFKGKKQKRDTGVHMTQDRLYWRQDSANQTGPVSMNVFGVVVLSAAVEQITCFRNSFHAPEFHSSYPGWAICQVRTTAEY